MLYAYKILSKKLGDSNKKCNFAIVFFIVLDLRLTRSGSQR